MAIRKKLTLKEAEQRITALENVVFNLRETLWRVEAAVVDLMPKNYRVDEIRELAKVEIHPSTLAYHCQQLVDSSGQQGPPPRGSKLRKRGLGKKA